MSKNIKIAKQLIKIAQELVAFNPYHNWTTNKMETFGVNNPIYLKHVEEDNNKIQKAENTIYKNFCFFERFLERNIRKKSDPAFEITPIYDVRIKANNWYESQINLYPKSIALEIKPKMNTKYQDKDGNEITIPEMSIELKILSANHNEQGCPCQIANTVWFGGKTIYGQAEDDQRVIDIMKNFEQLEKVFNSNKKTVSVDDLQNELSKKFSESQIALSKEIQKVFDASRGDKRVASRNLYALRVLAQALRKASEMF